MGQNVKDAVHLFFFVDQHFYKFLHTFFCRMKSFVMHSLAWLGIIYRNRSKKIWPICWIACKTEWCLLRGHLKSSTMKWHLLYFVLFIHYYEQNFIFIFFPVDKPNLLNHYVAVQFCCVKALWFGPLYRHFVYYQFHKIDAIGFTFWFRMMKNEFLKFKSSNEQLKEKIFEMFPIQNKWIELNLMKNIWVLLIRNRRKKDWIWRRRSRMTYRAHCTGNKTENQDARQN